MKYHTCPVLSLHLKLILIGCCRTEIKHTMNTGKWIRQEQEGTYLFGGTCYVTKGVVEALSEGEIRLICEDIKDIVVINDGIDYLLVYIHEDTKQKVFCIDQINKERIISAEHPQEQNYWTILLAEEY